MYKNQQNTNTAQSLEYIATLSGLSMAGDTITSSDIYRARRNHRKNHSSISLPATDSKH